MRELIIKELKKNKDRDNRDIAFIIKKKFPHKKVYNICKRICEQRAELGLSNREINVNEYYKTISKLIKDNPEMQTADIARRLLLVYTSMKFNTVLRHIRNLKNYNERCSFIGNPRRNY